MTQSEPFSIYVHIPFCYHKCPYCDFNTYAVTNVPEKDYVSALLAELDYRATLEEWRGRSIRTIFFGGGTPSLMTGFAIRRILSSIANLFPVDEDAEISLEANPGTVSQETLSQYREGGVNRLSIGAQTFHPQLLKTLGRIHSPAQTEEAVSAARSAGFNNLNLDLIYGIPDQKLPDLRSDLGMIADLNPEHVSAYGLTIEKGTPFYSRYRKGKMKLPPEDNIITMMEELEKFLTAAGYNRYEISNYAKEHREARHNLAYWNSCDYLGLGAGAHSCVFRHVQGGFRLPERWSNYTIPKKYMQEAMRQGHADSWRDQLTIPAAIFEYLFLGLRKIRGISLSQFRQRFGTSIEEAYPAQYPLLLEQGLIVREGDSLRLSTQGLMVTDSVVEEFTTPRTSHALPQPQAATAPSQVAIGA